MLIHSKLGNNSSLADSIINYFKDILESVNDISFDFPLEKSNTEKENPNKISAEILKKAIAVIGLDNLKSSVLYSYINGVAPSSIDSSKNVVIYPFGCNESQRKAVNNALENNISIIEGPPGTGKTQTILNIVANLIVQGKTMAIVSNNNSAVFNIREKLETNGYGMTVASLGNKDNKKSFFDNIGEQTYNVDFEIKKKDLENLEEDVQKLDHILTKCFKNRNKLSRLKTELSDVNIEFSHLKKEQPLQDDIKYIFDSKFYRRMNSVKSLKLRYLLSKSNIKSGLPFTTKLRFIFEYGFFDFKAINNYHKEFPVYVNHKFYELYIENLENEIKETKNWLTSHNEKEKLECFIEKSKDIFKSTLLNKYRNLEKIEFSENNYFELFDDFTKRYPVILSSTLSLHTSIPEGRVLDYLIIDEASQVDIIKSAVCFSCCKNVVIVGDSMQLTHIVDRQTQAVAESLKSKHNIPPAYDYVHQNILNSIKTLYGNKIKSVLLREHYRCHPTIIGFCNKKSYNNQLVIMTEQNSHPFRIIETNISGYRNGYYNQRQVDETGSYIKTHYSSEYSNVGVIAPYRHHAEKLRRSLPKGVESDTIHKFQGREKDVIIFNTVKGSIEPFIDNPNLINVAVSRAVKEFIVVKPEQMELPHGTNLGDLIRYICYTTDPKETIIKGSVCSVFDLLYKEYRKALASFLSSNRHIKGSDAEIIMTGLLQNKILNQPQFSSIDMIREYKLRDLVRDFELFSEDEIRFIMNNSRLDFLLYNKIDKTAVLAIEVDGISFHSNKIQQDRDDKKNHILELIGLPLLRLSTDGHDEEKQIIESLNSAMDISL